VDALSAGSCTCVSCKCVCSCCKSAKDLAGVVSTKFVLVIFYFHAYGGGKGGQIFTLPPCRIIFRKISVQILYVSAYRGVTNYGFQGQDICE